MLQSVQGFFASSVSVEPDEFRSFVKNYFADDPELLAIGWAPRLASDETTGQFEFRYLEPAGSPLTTLGRDAATGRQATVVVRP